MAKVHVDVDVNELTEEEQAALLDAENDMATDDLDDQPPADDLDDSPTDTDAPDDSENEEEEEPAPHMHIQIGDWIAQYKGMTGYADLGEPTVADMDDEVIYQINTKILAAIKSMQRAQNSLGTAIARRGEFMDDYEYNSRVAALPETDWKIAKISDDSYTITDPDGDVFTVGAGKLVKMATLLIDCLLYTSPSPRDS